MADCLLMEQHDVCWKIEHLETGIADEVVAAVEAADAGAAVGARPPCQLESVQMVDGQAGKRYAAIEADVRVPPHEAVPATVEA